MVFLSVLGNCVRNVEDTEDDMVHMEIIKLGFVGCQGGIENAIF